MVRHMYRTFSILFVILAVMGLIWVNFLVFQDLGDIHTQSPMPEGPSLARDSRNQPTTIRIGVVSRFAPNILYAGYQPIMDYLNQNGTYHYQLSLSTSYQGAVDRLKSNDVTASFLGAWITRSLSGEKDLVPMVAPLNSRGRSEFHTVLVTSSTSPITKLADLKGRKVALPSAQSWSGNWLKETGLPSVGLNMADLDSMYHFDHHQTVVWQVLGDQFDAGVVKESVAEGLASEGLRAIARSGPIPGPPLVGNTRAPAGVLAEIKRLLLALDGQNPQHRELLDSWSPEFTYGFTEVNWDFYQPELEPLPESP